MDSVFGGIRAYMEDSFDNTIFISGFFLLTLYWPLASLTWGDRLGLAIISSRRGCIWSSIIPKFGNNSSISIEKVLIKNSRQKRIIDAFVVFTNKISYKGCFKISKRNILVGLDVGD